MFSSFAVERSRSQGRTGHYMYYVIDQFESVYPLGSFLCVGHSSNPCVSPILVLFLDHWKGRRIADSKMLARDSSLARQNSLTVRKEHRCSCISWHVCITPNRTYTYLFVFLGWYHHEDTALVRALLRSCNSIKNHCISKNRLKCTLRPLLLSAHELPLLERRTKRDRRSKSWGSGVQLSEFSAKTGQLDRRWIERGCTWWVQLSNLRFNVAVCHRASRNQNYV